MIGIFSCCTLENKELKQRNGLGRDAVTFPDTSLFTVTVATSPLAVSIKGCCLGARMHKNFRCLKKLKRSGTMWLARFLKVCGNRPCYIPKVRASPSTPAILWQFRHLTVDSFIEVGLVVLVTVSRGCILTVTDGSCCFTLAIL